MYLPKKKANTICLTSERFISPAARTPRWKHRHFCWSFQVLSAIIRTLSTRPKAPGHFGEAANANSRNAKPGSLKKTPLLFGQKLNKIPYILCVVEQNPGDVPNPVGSSRFPSAPIFMHQKKSMMIFMYSDPGIAQLSYGAQKTSRDPGGLGTSEVKLLSYTPKKYTSKRGYHKSKEN